MDVVFEFNGVFWVDLAKTGELAIGGFCTMFEILDPRFWLFKRPPGVVDAG